VEKLVAEDADIFLQAFQLTIVAGIRAGIGG